MAAIKVEGVWAIGFILFGGGFAWVLALGQFAVEYRNRNNYLLVAYFSLIGIWQTLGGLGFLGLYSYLPFNIFALSVPCFFFSVPLLYLYFRFVINENTLFNRHHLIHFILPTASILFALPSVAEKTELYKVMNFLQYSDYHYVEISLTLMMYLAMLLLLGYMVSLLLEMKPLLEKTDISSMRHLRIVFWGCCLFILIDLFWFIDRMLSLGYLQAIYLLITLVLIGIYLLTIRYPQFLLAVRIEVDTAQTSRSQIQKLDAASILEKIDQAMRGQKLFRDETISLKSFAARLEITPHQLSEILNKKLHKSFYTLINEYRIAEAKEILRHDPDRKILAIAFDVGFNSPSAFYNAFQKFSGITPTKFREQQTRHSVLHTP